MSKEVSEGSDRSREWFSKRKVELWRGTVIKWETQKSSQ